MSMGAANLFQAYLQPPKSVVEYQNEYENADALRNRNALQSLTLQQQTDATQQSMQERNALRRIASMAGGDRGALVTGLRNSGMPGLMTQADSLEQSGAKLAESQSTAAKNTADAGKTTFETRRAKADQAVKDILALQSPDHAVQSIQQHLQAGDIDQVKAQQLLQSLPQDPSQFGAWQLKMARGILAAKDQIEMVQPKPTETALGNRKAFVDTNPQSPTYGKEVASAAVGQSPDNAATNATSRANNAATIKKDLAVAGINQDGTAADTGGLLSQESVINAAARYNMDGTLPPNLGRGTQGPRQTAQILNEAARQAAARGDTPEAQRIAQLANKANATALNKLETQQTMVGAFEKNFIKNASIVEELSNKMDRTGVPLLNKWVNAGKRAVTGDPEISALDASVKATVNEYAKIVGGGTGSAATAQGEIAKIEGLLSAAQTKDQVKSVLDLMRRETQNRMTAFDDQKTELKGSMFPANKTPKPAVAASGVPSDIADILKKHGGK